jgi:hypothetical protein
MAKKKVTTKKKAVESKKSVKKAVAKPEKVAEVKVEDKKEIPTEVVIEKKVCFVPYNPPKRLWSDTRTHINPDDFRNTENDDNPFLPKEKK